MIHFTINELTKSETATRLNIDNTPSDEVKSNLENLVDKILDPLRIAYGKPIIVTSGFRCAKLNKAVGGVATSDHLKGMAADIHGTPNTKAENRKIYDLCVKLNLPYRQLIGEKGCSWIHVSHNPGVKEHRHWIQN